MESVSKIAIFGTKTIVKSGLEFFDLKSIRPWGKKGIFVTEFVIWAKINPFYEVRENNFPHGGISK